jgi:hypothetical protein
VSGRQRSSDVALSESGRHRVRHRVGFGPAARGAQKHPGDRELEVVADSGGYDELVASRERHLLDAVDVDISAGRPDEVDDRANRFLVGADGRRALVDLPHFVGVRGNAELRALDGEQVHGGDHCGEGVADPLGDGDRLPRVLQPFRPVPKHVDLRPACERAGELDRFGQAGELGNRGLGRLERLGPAASEPAHARAPAEQLGAQCRRDSDQFVALVHVRPRLAPACLDHVELDEPEEDFCAPLVVVGELERSAELVARGAERSAARRAEAGHEEDLVGAPGNLRVVLPVGDCLPVVVADELRRLHVAVRGDRLDPLGHAPMEVPALRARQRPVSDVAGESVLEAEFPEPGHDGGRVRRDEASAREPSHGVLRHAHRRRPEHPPDHGAAAERVARLGLEQIEASGDDAVHGVRHTQLGQPSGRSPAAVLPLQGALVDQHLEHLLQEERIAFCACEQRPAHVVGHARLTEKRGDEPLRLFGRERCQRERGRVLLPRSPRRPLLQELWPGRADEQDAAVEDHLDDVLDQVEERG